MAAIMPHARNIADENRHGMADVLMDHTRPCRRSSPTSGECVFDGSSYFPVSYPPAFSCGAPDPSQSMPITVKHAADRVVVTNNDCTGPERMDCLHCTQCSRSEDCPPGHVCSGVSGTCVKPAELRACSYDLTSSHMDAIKHYGAATQPIEPTSRDNERQISKDMRSQNRRQGQLRHAHEQRRRGQRYTNRTYCAESTTIFNGTMWPILVGLVIATVLVLILCNSKK